LITSGRVPKTTRTVRAHGKSDFGPPPRVCILFFSVVND
jgi:hypothetical protein